MVNPEAQEELRRLYPEIAAWSTQATNAFLRNARIAEMKADTRLDTEDKHPEALILLLGGEKRVYKVDQGGKEITLYGVCAGEVCSLNTLSVVAAKPFPAQVHVREDATLLLIPAEDVRRLFADNEEVRAFLVTRLYQDVNDLIALTSQIAFRRISERLKDYLISKSDNGEIRATHQAIADDLGTAREVVSKLLKELEREGMVEMARGKVCINLDNWEAFEG